MNRIAIIMIASILATATATATAAPAQAGEPPLNLHTSMIAVSDYVFRGISQTQSRPAVQADLTLEHRSGLYASLWTSTVDFVPRGEPDDGARTEVDLSIGYGFELQGNWSADLCLVRYVFPSTHSGVNYDYNEIIATVSYADAVSVTAGWSSDVFGEGARGLALELGVRRDGPYDTEIFAGVGRYDLSGDYGRHYNYYDAGLAKAVGNFTVFLRYHHTDTAAADLFGSPVASSRFVLGIDFSR